MNFNPANDSKRRKDECEVFLNDRCRVISVAVLAAVWAMLRRVQGSLPRMGVKTEGVVNVGGFTEGQRKFPDFRRNSVPLRAIP